MENKDSRWPAGSILLCGTFGIATPSARRYHVRVYIALAALVVAAFLAKDIPPVPALLMGLAFTYINWEFRRYILSLDELARRLQLEAIAWTYLVGLPAAAFLGTISMATGWRINPMWFLLLEPIRGGFLFALSRKY